MEISDLVNTIEGLTEEQAVEIVARAETLAEEQTEELPRRKGAAVAARGAARRCGAADAEARRRRRRRTGSPADAIGSTTDSDSTTPIRDSDDDASSTILDARTAESEFGLALRTGRRGRGRFPPDDSTDSERDEASDDEIHDLALAAETSGHSPHGHEVTSPPSDADQGETIRIVTEAVGGR